MPNRCIIPRDWEAIAGLRFNGITQTQVAQKIGCQKQAIGFLERNNEEYQVFQREFLRGVAFETGRQFAQTKAKTKTEGRS